MLGQCRRPIQKGGYGGICVVVRATRSAFRGIRWICHRWGKRSLSSGWSPACRFQLRGPRRRRGRFPLSRGWQSAGELGINAIFAVKDREQKPAVIVQLGPTEADCDDTLLDADDQRKAVLRHIKQRRGQKAFRDSLIAQTAKCAVSCCEIVDILEAAISLHTKMIHTIMLAMDYLRLL